MRCGRVSAGRGDRPDCAAVEGEPLPAGVHHRPGPRRGVLAIAAHPQAGPSECAHPTARAQGIEELQILIDAHEQYAYRFAAQQASTVRRALPCGDYGLVVDGLLVASVERKSLADLVASLTGGKLRYQVADLAALPRAAVVVEDRYSQLFKLDRVRPAVVADGLAELQVRWPNVPVVFCETRQLAEEWTYRFLAAAHVWAVGEGAALQRISPMRIDISELHLAAAAPEPSTAEVRAWARAAGLPVPERGRLRPTSGRRGTTPTTRPEGRRCRTPSAQGPSRGNYIWGAASKADWRCSWTVSGRDVGVDEIVTHVQQWFTPHLGERIGVAVAEVERRRCPLPRRSQGKPGWRFQPARCRRAPVRSPTHPVVARPGADPLGASAAPGRR
ncbi:putative eRCC4 domain protein [Mycobacterium xenopi 4042]|uniref:Putative eRCC4 domain protein n=1 Tax=Mycobacterium xenopi 4042 TaxID=1299334 RepID=X8CAA3_MYCXE|nr:putative eRCC4 domain protein [Mycobacterium xenopi 4042]